jgi:flavorubredoxin
MHFSPLKTSKRKAQKVHFTLLVRENCLKVLIMYDTTSVNRNTEKVAKAISEVLIAKGYDVDWFWFIFGSQFSLLHIG